jgi:hypothetical protein
MAQWPRRITRGPLKGQVYGSEKEYRQAYGERTGLSRYRQRQARARKLGYSGYYERRKILRKLQVQAGSPREARFLRSRIKHKLKRNVESGILFEVERFRERTTEQRIASLSELAEQEGMSRS